MAKTPRFNYTIFAAEADLDQMGVVGSLRAGSPTYSLDPEVIQSLINYRQGWFDISMGDNSPAMEDQNGVQHVTSKAVFVLYEMGVPEWNAGTEYQLNSFVNNAGVLYISLQNVNKNHALTDNAWWAKWNNTLSVVTQGPGVGPYNMARNDSLIRVNATGAPGGVAQVILMPTANVPIGHTIRIKNVSTSATPATLTVSIVTGNSGTETIDGVLGAVVLDCFPSKEFITLTKTTATNWDIIG